MTNVAMAADAGSVIRRRMFRCWTFNHFNDFRMTLAASVICRACLTLGWLTRLWSPASDFVIMASPSAPVLFTSGRRSTTSGLKYDTASTRRSAPPLSQKSDQRGPLSAMAVSRRGRHARAAARRVAAARAVRGGGDAPRAAGRVTRAMS